MRNFIIKWCIPPGFKTLLRRRSEKVPNFELPEASKNIELKQKHLGQRCFILATGPSVKNQELSWLNNELTISVGSFFLHDDIQAINPKYHVLAPAHPPFEFPAIEKIFKGFKDSFNGHKEPTVLMGVTGYQFSYKNFLKDKPSYMPNNLYQINYDLAPNLEENNFLDESTWDLCKKPFAIRTVIYTAIQFAVYAGCKEIYLIGCDHDYLSDMGRTTNHHFYNDSKSYSDKAHLEGFSTERWFEEYYMRWKQYRLIKDYCKLKGTEIYNATIGGMLDVFERVDLNSLKNQ